MVSNLLRPRNLVLVLVVLIVAAGAYAFANANVIDPTSAGSGSEAISGFNVENIVYTVNGTDPTQVDAVTMDVTPTIAGSPAATTVQVRVTGSGSWTSCINGSGSTWTCTFSAPVDTELMTELEVVAYQ